MSSWQYYKMNTCKTDKTHTEKVEIRKFGITIAAALVILAGFFWWRGKEYYIYFVFISFAFLFFTLSAPVVLKPVYKIWMLFALILNRIMTGVILSILFYLILTPIGFLGKLFGENYLNLKLNKHNKSYWIPKEKRSGEKSDHEKQF